MAKWRGDARARGAGRRLFRGLGAICAIVAAALAGAFPGAAAAHRWHGTVQHAAAYAPIFEWVLLDAETGQVLGEQNADALTYPASLTKMMTLYLTFEALNQGRISLDQRFAVSEHAATRAPSKLGLTPGQTVSIRDLILAIVTKSANDAATVLAEGLGGSEASFARTMTLKARQLGMDHTWYDNASGLPDPGNRTTARDVARLALALYHQFPREYRYFSTREFDFNGEIVHGHDHLLDWYPGADGIKTGFINASGFNLASSAVRNGHRLIGVIMGGRTWRSRDEQMGSLLDQGFAILAKTQPAPPRSAPLVVVATAAPAPVAPAPAAAAPVHRAEASAHQPSGFLRHVATAALQHLAPVSKAEAAPLARGRADWSVQLGAFRTEATAEHVARKVVRLATFRGKPSQILAPARHDSNRLYRTRLLHFTERGAQAACAELRRKGIECAVVAPDGVRFASR